MKIEIDKKSGFCFGVINAISKAETELARPETLYCLGDIVHNGAEVDRLTKLGMVTISREEYYQLSNCKVLIRAHGEPPETYKYADNHNITLIDATCPVVLNLQQRVKNAFENFDEINGQIVIFGKYGHAEIVGINGHIKNKAILIEHKEDIAKIDFKRPIAFYSQTTKSIEEFREIANLIAERAGKNVPVKINDTICRQVANREPHLQEFVKKFDTIIFVSGIKSSNGAALYNVCKAENPRTMLVARTSDLQKEWFTNVSSVGICGATSTPKWLMEEIAAWIQENADYS